MSLRLDQISASKDNDGRVLGAEPVTDTVDLTSTAKQVSKSISDISFSAKTGKLVFIREDGNVVEVTGLPTATAFGIGLPGPRGLPGPDGQDGRDGRDGPDGDKGCEGPIGDRGIQGEQGEAGEDGPRGREGPPGYYGERGPDGLEGPEGSAGVAGPIGNTGPSCLAGIPGPTGPAPYDRVVTSARQPLDSKVFGWLFPTSPEDPNPIPLPELPDISASVSDVHIVAKRLSSVSNVFEAETYLIPNVRNAVGPVSFRWSVSEMSGVSLIDAKSEVARLSFNKTIGPGVYWEEEGTITLHAYDEGRPRRPRAVAEAKIKITANNPLKAENGCIVFGSTVITPAGSCLVEDLREGMLVMAVSGQPKHFRDWSAPALKSPLASARIVSIAYGEEDHYYRINGQGFTHEHPVLVFDGKMWKYVPARDVQTKHKVLGTKGPQNVYECLRINERVRTADIDVDPHDVFFVGDVLAHNSDVVSKQEKGA